MVKGQETNKGRKVETRTGIRIKEGNMERKWEERRKQGEEIGSWRKQGEEIGGKVETRRGNRKKGGNMDRKWEERRKQGEEIG